MPLPALHFNLLIDLIADFAEYAGAKKSGLALMNPEAGRIFWERIRHADLEFYTETIDA